MSSTTTDVLEKMFLDEVYFAKTCFPEVMEVETPEFHKHLYRLLSDRMKRYVAIVAPRGHAKSTVSTTFVPLHRLLFGLEKNILLISESETQAKAHLENIKNHLENNENIKTYFPGLEFKKWSEDRIIVTGGPFDADCQILVRGMNQKFRGLNYHQKRPTLIIMDDVESEDNMDSPEIRAKVKDKIDAAIIPARDMKEGRVFMIGTIVHHDSYLNEIILNAEKTKSNVGKSGRWEYVFFQAIYNFDTNNERALWPEWLPLKELHAERKELASKDREYLWWQEYMNKPVAGDNQIFKPEYFNDRHNYHVQYKFGENWLVDRVSGDIRCNCDVFLGVDPAISTNKRADYFAMAIIAVTPDDKSYVLNVKLAKIKSATAQANLILTYAFNFHAKAIGIEAVAYQQALATQVRERMQESNNYYRIVEFKPRDKKNERLKNLEWPISSGKMKFPIKKGDKTGVEMTIEMFKTFPKSKKDDGMDAVYYADKVSITPPKVSEHTVLSSQPNKVTQTEENWKVL